MQQGYNLSSLTQSCEKLRQVEKARLHPGDWMYVQTRNSSYAIRTLDDGYFEISGGWFDREGGSPQKLRINGCTWGARASKQTSPPRAVCAWKSASSQGRKRSAS